MRVAALQMFHVLALSLTPYPKKEEESQHTDPKGAHTNKYTKYDQWGKKQRSKHFQGKEGDQETEQDQSWKSHEDKPWKKGDWECPKCKYHNYASRYTCHRCNENWTKESVWQGGGGGGGGGGGSSGGGCARQDSDTKRHKGELMAKLLENQSKFMDVVKAMQ